MAHARVQRTPAAGAAALPLGLGARLRLARDNSTAGCYDTQLPQGKPHAGQQFAERRSEYEFRIIEM